MLISLIACFIAAGSFIGYNFSENNHNTDISLADISVMAQAGGEQDPCPGGPTVDCKWIDEDQLCDWSIECLSLCYGGCW